jgi:hypothetical protein
MARCDRGGRDRDTALWPDCLHQARLYLHGQSSGDFQDKLLLGEDAAGLSTSTVTRLTMIWHEE